MIKLAQTVRGPKKVNLGAWKKQPVDHRDAAYSIKLHRGFLDSARPSSWDNRKYCSPIEDQGSLGSCTAHAFAACIEANEKRGLPKLNDINKTANKATANIAISGVTTSSNGAINFQTGITTNPSSKSNAKVTISNTNVSSNGNVTYTTTISRVAAPAPAPKLIDASRLFQYYATRKIEGNVSTDSGATIRGAIKAGVQYGVVNESLYPYDITKFANNPPVSVWNEAAKNKVTSYHAINDGDLETMKSVLVSGFLIQFGFLVYDNFLSLKMSNTGLLCLPSRNETLQGGHAVALVGYDDNMKMPDGSTGAFLVRNSWGTGWGWQGSGYFWMAYNYVGNTDLCNDFWVVKSAPL